jgi:hypothetical protein
MKLQNKGKEHVSAELLRLVSEVEVEICNNCSRGVAASSWLGRCYSKGFTMLNYGRTRDGLIDSNT